VPAASIFRPDAEAGTVLSGAFQRFLNHFIVEALKMIRQKIPMLSSWTLDELGTKMKCDRCGKRPERNYPVRQSDAPGFAKGY
jgi:hypothetical protein